MKKETKNYYAYSFKWQEIVHNSEYTPSGKDTYHYTTLEHEAVVLYCRKTGEHIIIKHK